MKIEVFPYSPSGAVRAIASKSVAHRLLICAAFADKKTLIRCEQTNNDIEATVACLNALGTQIKRVAPYYEVTPVAPCDIKKNAILPCKESGSTLRFLIPIVAALGADSSFLMEGRLPERPLSPLREELEAHGISFKYRQPNMLSLCGKLCGDKYEIAGNVSSQFISGLLFGLSLLPFSSELTVIGKIESAPYIEITLDALSAFCRTPQKSENSYKISAFSPFTSPLCADVEGDWSNAAFMLALGAMGKSVCVSGLKSDSSQGDSKIIELLERFGADVIKNETGYTVKHSKLHGISIDASQIPDLVPILATLASIAEGKTEIYGASRLRIKESDRIESVCSMLSSLGADIMPTDDGMIINGRDSLEGGACSSFNDHRIAMSAAVAACTCKSSVLIDNAEATAKSYPDFWSDLEALGAKYTSDI